MAAADVRKIDMSLDDIISSDRKAKGASRGGRGGNRGGRGAGRGGRGVVRGRGGRLFLFGYFCYFVNRKVPFAEGRGTTFTRLTRGDYY